MYIYRELKLNIKSDEKKLLTKLSHILKVSEDTIDQKTFQIVHKAIDARDKNNIMFIYNVIFDFKEKYKDIIIKDKNVSIYHKPDFSIVVSKEKNNSYLHPIIVGLGPAGLFAAYTFVRNGIKPIILERGKRLDDRIKDTETFFKTLKLDENSNVCFGEGGAGAFSDGKLNTNNKDKTGIYNFVLETFVRFGADESILYNNLPHIGTDKLIKVIANMRNEIIRMGAVIRYGEKFVYDDYKVAAADTPIILAIGNSSRDTFRDLIKNGFNLRPKPLAIGFRVMHRQALINILQYGENEEVRFLPPATYKLSYNLNSGRSIYSFCMCPGGYVINSSNFKEHLSINGMSYNKRDGLYANSALVETIKVNDIGENVDALGAIEFIENIENKAYKLNDGYIPYCNIGALYNDNGLNRLPDENVAFKGLSRYNEHILDIYEDIGLKFSIKNDLKEALIHFNKIMPGFYGENLDDIFIAGVETRTSSPVSLDRDDSFMCNILNFYPCGEGLGHGGGIMSSAVDGINVALTIIKRATNK